jgi:hypothetical protein
MYDYLKKFATGAIRIRLEQPNLDDLPSQDFDWCNSTYGNVKEVLPKDLPWPLGREVTIITYTDANFYHEILTGRS